MKTEAPDRVRNKNDTFPSSTRRYLLYAIGEIVLVVIGILIAISIDNWNDNRKDIKIEQKLLVEISNGLDQDLIDVESNSNGNKIGLEACKYWLNIFRNDKVTVDSIGYYYHYLTRDFISIQNVSGYESLKSKGLELVTNDSLRIEIIKLYEQDYSIIRKLEEEYAETQFAENYFKEFNTIIAPSLIFDEEGELTSINLPLNLPENEQRLMLSYLWEIKRNRQFILQQYGEIEQNIRTLQISINKIL